MILTFPLIPISAGVAVLRHRLYDIDLVINRALVYGSLTALLAASYVGLALLLGLALGPLTSGSDLAIAALHAGGGGAVRAGPPPGADAGRPALLPPQVRRRAHPGALRRRACGAETDLDALRTTLTGVVRETMQPAHVSLWLRPDRPPRPS